MRNPARGDRPPSRAELVFVPVARRSTALLSSRSVAGVLEEVAVVIVVPRHLVHRQRGRGEGCPDFDEVVGRAAIGEIAGRHHEVTSEVGAQLLEHTAQHRRRAVTAVEPHHAIGHVDVEVGDVRANRRRFVEHRTISKTTARPSSDIAAPLIPVCAVEAGASMHPHERLVGIGKVPRPCRVGEHHVDAIAHASVGNGIAVGEDGSTHDVSA